MSQSATGHDLQQMVIPLPTGVSLEVDFIRPLHAGEGGQRLAVSLHPWSWLGGQKDDPCGISYRAIIDPDLMFFVESLALSLIHC